MCHVMCARGEEARALKDQWHSVRIHSRRTPSSIKRSPPLAVLPYACAHVFETGKIESGGALPYHPNTVPPLPSSQYTPL